jgi:hypothetical protein
MSTQLEMISDFKLYPEVIKEIVDLFEAALPAKELPGSFW